MNSQFPRFSQWKQIFKVLKRKEKAILSVLLALAVGSLGFLVINFYLGNTKVTPAAGGAYREGAVGQPRFINPIYGETNDIDRTMIELIFSGLMTYDKGGQITKDLADSYKISDDGKTYDFKLKNNIVWHDGKPLTAEDIVFTIKTIQNSDYKSPLRANWIDVTVEKTSEKSVRFSLKTAYNSFLENATVKIIPKHIWGSILPENFALSFYNLQPIGSGPFAFSEIRQTDKGFIKILDLKSNRKYYNRPVFINQISFRFFEKKEDLIKTAEAEEIDGFTLIDLDNNKQEAEKEIKQWLPQDDKLLVYSFSLPRYVAVFFKSDKSSIFQDSNIRKALTYAVNKNELIKKLSDDAKNNIGPVESPILPDFFNYQKPSSTYSFDVSQAESFLDKAGFKKNNQGLREKIISKKPAFQFDGYLAFGSQGTQVTQLQSCLARLDESFKNELQNETNGKYGKGTEKAITEFQKKYLPDKDPTGETGKATRGKLNELCLTPPPDSQPLKFTLTTVNQPPFLKTALILKDYWRTVGVEIDINAVSLTDLKPIIKNRSYDALLYGQALGAEPDLYPFWHSSQKIDPGLNLSSYDNKDADKLLKEAREILDWSVKKQKYEQLQSIIISDAPALFLYNPDYLYWVVKKVKGVETEKIIDPAKRFVNVANWHINTKRTWK